VAHRDVLIRYRSRTKRATIRNQRTILNSGFDQVGGRRPEEIIHSSA
jgi:hypothetical protein